VNSPPLFPPAKLPYLAAGRSSIKSRKGWLAASPVWQGVVSGYLVDAGI